MNTFSKWSAVLATQPTTEYPMTTLVILAWTYTSTCVFPEQFLSAEDVTIAALSAWYVPALPSTSAHRNVMYFSYYR